MMPTHTRLTHSLSRMMSTYLGFRYVIIFFSPTETPHRLIPTLAIQEIAKCDQKTR